MSFDVADAALNADIVDFATALQAVILGSTLKATKSVHTIAQQGSAAPPANVNANRQNKWLFRVQDNTTGQIYTHEIGTADNADLPSPTTDFLDLSAGVGLALKTEWDALYQSPDGNAGTLLSVQQINRSGN
jgi:hypothetical protein